jgi:hypothetical protein
LLQGFIQNVESKQSRFQLHLGEAYKNQNMAAIYDKALAEAALPDYCWNYSYGPLNVCTKDFPILEGDNCYKPCASE